MSGIRYISFTSESGYGAAARSYILGLDRAGVNMSWTPMVPGTGVGTDFEPFEGPSIGDPVLDRLCNRTVDYDTAIIHLTPSHLSYWLRRESGKKIFLYTTWETTEITGRFVRLLNRANGVMVPSQWNKDVFERCGGTAAITVVPHIFTPPAAQAIPPPVELPGEDFVFYTIGTWTARKAMDETILAFLEEFDAGEPAVFVVKTGPNAYTPTFFSEPRLRRYLYMLNPWVRFPKRLNPYRLSSEKKLEELRGGFDRPARVILATEPWSEAQIDGLHRRGDCFFSLTRGEGWGLGAFDAAGRGNPVVITGFGGQTDYLDRESAHLVPYDLVRVRDDVDVVNFRPAQRWARADRKAARRALRYVFENRVEAREKAMRARRRIEERYGAAAVTRRMLDAVGLA